MASTKEMQLRAKLRKQMANGQPFKVGVNKEGNDVYATGLNATTPKYNLYKTQDIRSNVGGFGLSIMLPEGMQSYKTEAVNISVIRRGDDTPCESWMTGYGASYMSKLAGGTARAYEFQINAFADNDESGDMLQIFGTAWDNVKDKTTQNFDEKLIVAKVLNSLPQQYQKLFVAKYLKVESGKTNSPVGWALDPKQKQTA
jgi:hypothetical protein